MTKIVRRTRRQVYELWIKALRSGKYEQTRGQLRSGGAFCCLGVLCDLARGDGGPNWGRNGEFIEDPAFLPSPIVKFMALDGPDTNLMHMNDSGESFADIATYIEKHVMPRACKEPQ